MFDFEYNRADLTLEETKESLLEYLKNCKYHDRDPEQAARDTFKYLESIVEKVIKRQDVKINFHSGGAPIWFSTVMYYMSKWIAAELKISKIITEELDKLEPDGPKE